MKPLTQQTYASQKSNTMQRKAKPHNTITIIKNIAVQGLLGSQKDTTQPPNFSCDNFDLQPGNWESWTLCLVLHLNSLDYKKQHALQDSIQDHAACRQKATTKHPHLFTSLGITKLNLFASCSNFIYLDFEQQSVLQEGCSLTRTWVQKSPDCSYEHPDLNLELTRVRLYWTMSSTMQCKIIIPEWSTMQPLVLVWRG